MIYWASATAASDSEIQRRNLDFAAQELAKCEPRGEQFFYVEPAEIMFDMSAPSTRIVESTPLNPSCYAGSVAQIMEQRVLEYSHGHVIRTAPFIESAPFQQVFSDMRCGLYGGCVLLEQSFQFSSRWAVAEIGRCTIAGTREFHEELGSLRHICSGIRFTTSYIAFQLLGEDFNIDFSRDRMDPRLTDLGVSSYGSSLCSERGDRLTAHFFEWSYRKCDDYLKSFRRKGEE